MNDRYSSWFYLMEQNKNQWAFFALLRAGLGGGSSITALWRGGLPGDNAPDRVHTNHCYLPEQCAGLLLDVCGQKA